MFGQESDMLFIRKEEKAKYELRSNCMLLLLQRPILDGDNSQDLILPMSTIVALTTFFPWRGSSHGVIISENRWTSSTGFKKRHLFCLFSFHGTALRPVLF